MALACVASVCAWVVCGVLGAPGGDVAQAMPEEGARRSDPAPALFEARFYLGDARGRFSLSDTPQPDDFQIAAMPLQPDAGPAVQNPPHAPQVRRLAERAPPPRRHLPGAREAARPERVASNAPASEPTIFQKLFGKPNASPSIFEKLFGASGSQVKLAYATPGDVAGDGAAVTSGLYDRQTAVYDISAHTVYMPDGTTLEAHSGLGSRLDDPRHVNERSRGATPPDIYDLKAREALFHGVRALRLLPVDERKVFGRSGLLAHTYMLGPNGQSNGCVSFKDYDAFLRAYENHQIRRLAVVARVE